MGNEPAKPLSLPAAPGQVLQTIGKASGSSPVTLHIYNIGTSNAGIMFTLALHSLGLGAAHVGMEVHGIEWSFTTGGITWCRPRCAEGHSYSSSELLGTTRKSDKEVLQLINTMKARWPGQAYQRAVKDSLHFAEKLSDVLGAGEIPAWVKALGAKRSGYECASEALPFACCLTGGGTPVEVAELQISILDERTEDALDRFNEWTSSYIESVQSTDGASASRQASQPAAGSRRLTTRTYQLVRERWHRSRRGGSTRSRWSRTATSAGVAQVGIGMPEASLRPASFHKPIQAPANDKAPEPPRENTETTDEDTAWGPMWHDAATEESYWSDSAVPDETGDLEDDRMLDSHRNEAETTLAPVHEFINEYSMNTSPSIASESRQSVKEASQWRRGTSGRGRSESHEYESEPTRASAAPSDGSQGPSEGAFGDDVPSEVALSKVNAFVGGYVGALLSSRQKKKRATSAPPAAPAGRTDVTAAVGPGYRRSALTRLQRGARDTRTVQL